MRPVSDIAYSVQFYTRGFFWTEIPVFYIQALVSFLLDDFWDWKPHVAEPMGLLDLMTVFW